MRELGNLFQQILAGVPSTAELEQQFPFYPLDAPGMPAPGRAFTEAAIAMGDSPPVIEGSGGADRANPPRQDRTCTTSTASCAL